MPQKCCWNTDPNHVGTFIYGQNRICCWEPFSFKKPSPRRRQDHAAPASRDQQALDLVRAHLHTARSIILSHRNTWKNIYHVYDEADAALNREWVPTMNNQVLASLGYYVDVRGFLHGIRREDQRQLLYIGVFDASHASRTEPEKHIGELPTKRKTEQERIRDLQRDIREDGYW